MLGRDRIQYKNADQVRQMRLAGLVVAEALAAVQKALTPGVTTAELDAVAEDTIRSAGAIPSFIGVPCPVRDDGPSFPATLCVSVNEEVVHGIPGRRRIQAGDVVSVDCGAIVDGWHGDAAFTMVVPGPAGAVDPEDAALSRVTEEALWRGIAAAASGGRLNLIGAAVEDHVAGRYGLVEDYGGHGIGTEMHQDPQILNYRIRERGPRLRPGMCLAVEPMLTIGAPRVHTLDDDWTVATVDGASAAHWEHTFAVLDRGLWVLTAHDGGAEALGALGIPVTPLAD